MTKVAFWKNSQMVEVARSPTKVWFQAVFGGFVYECPVEEFDSGTITMVRE